MEIEFTNGMVMMICGVAAFVVISIVFVIFMTITSKKMNKILKSNEFQEGDDQES